MPLVLGVMPLLRQRVVVGGKDALLSFKQWEPQPSEAKTHTMAGGWRVL